MGIASVTRSGGMPHWTDYAAGQGLAQPPSGPLCGLWLVQNPDLDWSQSSVYAPEHTSGARYGWRCYGDILAWPGTAS